MKKNLSYFTIILAACALVTSCLPEKAETALTYKGPTVVEIKNHTLLQIDTILNRKGVYTCTTQTDSSRSVNQTSILYKGTANTANTLSCVTAGGTVYPFRRRPTPNTYQLLSDSTLAANARIIDTIYVQLVGPQSSSPIVLSYTVRSSTAAVNPSTAVEGVNYDFIPAGARTVTIPANKSVGYILTTVKQGLTASATTARISIDLVGNAEIKPNPNYSKFFLTIRKN